MKLFKSFIKQNVPVDRNWKCILFFTWEITFMTEVLFTMKLQKTIIEKERPVTLLREYTSLLKTFQGLYMVTLFF